MVGYFWDTIKTVQAAVPKKIVNAQLVHNISQRSEMIDVYGYIEHNRTISPGHHFFMEVQIGTIWMALQKGIKKGVPELFLGYPNLWMVYFMEHSLKMDDSGVPA